MASDEVRKKWGTIFMGEREASVEQLKAMQEHVNREKQQKEQAEDYMERVRARATDRAREILGQAYAERQKVLEEAKADASFQKRLALQECAKIKAEGETIRNQAAEELEKAQQALMEAEKIREGAQEEGYKAGMDQAGRELHEFRAELGQSLSALMRAIERQRAEILENWRNDLADLTKTAIQAGTGYILKQEHEGILRSLVFQALDMLENRSAITARVNPADEETVSDFFRAARERVPELRQWTVTGDPSIEPGGLVADSGSGSVDLRRENFRELVSGILEHLGLPEQDWEAGKEQEVANIVEREVANIAALTPEPDKPEAQLEAETQPEPAAVAEEADAPEEIAAEEPQEANAEEESLQITEEMPEPAQEMETQDSVPDTSLAELEDELFPLDDMPAEAGAEQAPEPTQKDSGNESNIFTEGGFL